MDKVAGDAPYQIHEKNVDFILDNLKELRDNQRVSNDFLHIQRKGYSSYHTDDII